MDRLIGQLGSPRPASCVLEEALSVGAALLEQASDEGSLHAAAKLATALANATSGRMGLDLLAQALCWLGRYEEAAKAAAAAIAAQVSVSTPEPRPSHVPNGLLQVQFASGAPPPPSPPRAAHRLSLVHPTRSQLEPLAEDGEVPPLEALRATCIERSRALKLEAVACQVTARFVPAHA